MTRAELKDREWPLPQVGELWRDWVNGGSVVSLCVVLAVGSHDVVLGVLEATGGFIEEDMVKGRTVVRSKVFVSRYWRRVL